MSRKFDKTKMGGTTDEGIRREVPLREAAYTSIISPESLIVKLFRGEIDRLVGDERLLKEVFAQIFDATIGSEEREEFTTHFLARFPKTYLGYARAGGEFPCYAVTLMDESEDETFLGSYVGERDEDESQKPSEYVGSFWSSTYGIYVYAEHPDVCLYLYQFAKMLMTAGNEWLLSNGIQEIKLSGGELAPDQNYMPENMFIRVLRVTTKVPNTFLAGLLANPRHIKLVGLHREDVVVDGVPGGVDASGKDDEE